MSEPVPLLDDLDTRTAELTPSAAQEQLVDELDAQVRWNRFGTPQTLVRNGEFLATGLPGANAKLAALEWIDQHRSLFRLDSTDGLERLSSSQLTDSQAHVVSFQQTYDGLPAADGGVLTFGLTGSEEQGWNLAYVSSSASGDSELAASSELSAKQAWLAAADGVGGTVSETAISAAGSDREWTLFDVEGLAQPQRAREVAFPTVNNGVRPAWETIVLDQEGGQPIAYLTIVDASTGDVLLRKNLVHQSHSPADVFSGTMPAGDGACADAAGPWEVGSGEEVGSVAVAVEALLTANDSVVHLLRDGKIVASQDTLTSPEALTYDPTDNGQGRYTVQVCDYKDGAGWLAPNGFAGEVVFSPADVSGDLPYPPSWQVFPANPDFGSSADTRETWCWDTGSNCDRYVGNIASRAPWDFSPRTNTPTFTTMGNNAFSAEAWTGPLTPGPTGFRPVSVNREYGSDFQDAWRKSDCFTPFVPGASHDISAAVTNLFVMHNRMHDWSYQLGFNERAWNAQESNFGTSNSAEHDPLLGDAQAGAVDGGFPSYLGRDNANMVTLPDGVAPITNMYLWQPIAGAFYAPCSDGDFDMSVIGHEYGHLIENRMIGKGDSRGGHHAGALGESFGDLNAVEYLQEYGFAPVGDENPFAVGPYVTGNKQTGIRNYGMDNSPLNFSDMGYDITGAQVHADGEIWSAVNFDIRKAYVEKYTGFDPGDVKLQRACADGKRAVKQCPGNRRWMQTVYDAMLMMPIAPSMLDARDAYLAADLMRFGGANQEELWHAFAKRGFGAEATSSNTPAETDTDPVPDFSSPEESNASVRFQAVGSRSGDPVQARIFVGKYEARVSPTAVAGVSEAESPNLDDTAEFVPGTYELVAQAPGYGHAKFDVTLAAGENRTVQLTLPENLASGSSGAEVAGDGRNRADLIDDTEATNWDVTGAELGIDGKQVTVDLAGGRQTFDRLQVSTLLMNQNRFTALRQFEILTCDATVSSCDAAAGGFEKVYTSPADAFPGNKPRPTAPQMLMRGFDLPETTATHVRIRVVSNQCTGNQAFQGEQDADPLNGTDCRIGSPGSELVELPGDVPQVIAPRDDEVHIAELQLFDGTAVVG